MEAGKLNRRVTIQALTNTPDTYGGNVESWSTVATVWASIKPATGVTLGREFFSSAQLNMATSYVVTIRYKEGITHLNRLLFGARVFKIHAVINPGEGRRELQLMCEEVVTSE